MAEERLIDDDKDKKYKIRKNADGEDELVIDEGAGDDGESDIPLFEVSVFESDDEEAAQLTPEQFAERKRKAEEEQKLRAEKKSARLAAAREKFAAGDFEAALYEVNCAEEITPNDGEVYCVKLMALTRNFTDFTSLDDCVAAADGVRLHADEKQKSELQPFAAAKGFRKQVDEARAKTEMLATENERKKAVRRQVFADKKRRAITLFACAAVPFAALAVLAIVFASMIFAAENGLYLILTIAFGALAAVALIFVLITAHRLWDACRNCKLNETDLSTKLGREYLEAKAAFDKLNRIYSLFDL